MADFLIVGQIGRPHGLKGEAHITVLTDFPERLKPGVILFVGSDHAPITIRECRWQHSDLLLAFEGYPERNGVTTLCNQYLFVCANDRPALAEGEYYHHQLIGLKVFNIDAENPHYLGTLSEILSTGANDVYVIANKAEKDILIPALESTILSIDLELGQMMVYLLPGLIE